MKKIEKLTELLNLWNEISNYKYTFEIIGSRMYIKNVVTIKAITTLYNLLEMVQDFIVYIREDKESYEIELEVLEI